MKTVKWLLASLLSLSLVATTACSSGSSGTTSDTTASSSDTKASGDGTSITILMGKPEVGKQFEQMLTDYSAANGVNVTMIPLAGQDAYEKMTSLYASGNAPTIMMVGQEFSEFQDKFLDLSDTEFIKRASEGTTDFVTVDGKAYGTPVTVEAYGIIYNPTVVSGALGDSFDPATIKTHDELKKFFADIKASGTASFTLSPMDWSIGAHLSNSMFAAQSEDRDTRHAFMQDLKAGNVNLIENKVFNGWVDTFDILLAENLHKDAPLAAVYEDGSLEMATSEAASWFMGNWAYPELVGIEKLDYRFIPVPVSNDPNEYGNGKIAVGVPSYWCVDKSANTPEQQKAALDFLNWFITTPEGQENYVNQLNFIPAYSDFQVSPSDSMSKQIVDLLEKGETLEWMNTYYPAGGFQAMGASMQKYIDGKIDRAGLAKEFEEYWKNSK